MLRACGPPVAWDTTCFMPTTLDALHRAVQRHQAGDFAAAGVLYEQILAAEPEHADALHLLGLVRRKEGRLLESEALIRKAITLTAPAMRPVMAGNLGNVLVDQGRHREAAHLFRQSAEAMPADTDLLLKLGNSLWVSQLYPEAIAVYRRAITLCPDKADFFFNIGVAWQRQGQQAKAESAFRDTLRLDPRHVAAWNSLGTVLRRQGRLEEAVAAHRAGLAVNPQDWETHKCLGLTLLLKGDYTAGFRHYEERRKTEEGRTIELPLPEWEGDPLGERTLLIHAEQGLGDTLNFIRYAPLVRQNYGGRVLFGCPAPLQRLLAPLPGIDALIPFGAKLPPFDVHVPLLSLPRLMGTTVETIPPPDPPLAAAATEIAAWKERLGPRREALRVGVVWSGNPDFKNNRFRSPGLESFWPLFDLPDIRFYVLQKGGGRAALEGRTLPDSCVDLDPWLQDFADTAAAVANLDLVISMCTSVAHLCGAMRHPVWVLLSSTPDWRWLLERHDSPWYPSARLFRQPHGESWLPVMAAVRTALQEETSGRTSPASPPRPPQAPP